MTRYARSWSGGITFSPDGRRIAVLAASPSGSHYDLVLWDVAARRLLYRLTLPANPIASNPPAEAAWTRDGRAVAVGSGTGLLSFYDSATGTQTRSVRIPERGRRNLLTPTRRGTR